MIELKETRENLETCLEQYPTVEVDVTLVADRGLEFGKVVESGTHPSLIELNGVYRELYKKQVEELKER